MAAASYTDAIITLGAPAVRATATNSGTPTTTGTRQLGVPKVITRVGRPANLRLFERVGIDVAISARGAAVATSRSPSLTRVV